MQKLILNAGAREELSSRHVTRRMTECMTVSCLSSTSPLLTVTHSFGFVYFSLNIALVVR